jgi:hypothetical protein
MIGQFSDSFRNPCYPSFFGVRGVGPADFANFIPPFIAGGFHAGRKAMLRTL